MELDKNKVNNLQQNTQGVMVQNPLIKKDIQPVVLHEIYYLHIHIIKDSSNIKIPR